MGLTCNNENGFVLGFTILFMAVLMILGSSAVVMTRAEIKVSDNYKNSERAFFAAQGGTGHAREVLREINTISTDPSSFSVRTTISTFGLFPLPATITLYGIDLLDHHDLNNSQILRPLCDTLNNRD